MRTRCVKSNLRDTSPYRTASQLGPNSVHYREAPLQYVGTWIGIYGIARSSDTKLETSSFAMQLQPMPSSFTV